VRDFGIFLFWVIVIGTIMVVLYGSLFIIEGIVWGSDLNETSEFYGADCGIRQDLSKFCAFSNGTVCRLEVYCAGCYSLFNCIKER
jgi:hypothetical protein